MRPADIFIPVNDYITIHSFGQQDWVHLVNYLNDEKIFQNTLLTPVPYTRDAAMAWIERARKESFLKNQGGNWGIYFHDYGLIGGIGIEGLPGKRYSHQTEIGYWLAEPFRKKGYMTDVIRTFTTWVFKYTDYQKIIASVFVRNIDSERLLLRCGFEKEGLLRRHIWKNNQLIDCSFFGLLKP